MNPKYFGDSYDLVKRFFCHELSLLGYSVVVDAMLTGAWDNKEKEFYRLIGGQPATTAKSTSKRTAFFLDPNTGINEKGSKQHASFDRLAGEATNNELAFAFDQAFSRLHKARDVALTKLTSLQSRGCHGMYYDSHARFVFVSKRKSSIVELQRHLQSLGLPASRLITVGD